jgi:hypothetical protein
LYTNLLVVLHYLIRISFPFAALEYLVAGGSTSI